MKSKNQKKIKNGISIKYNIVCMKSNYTILCIMGWGMGGGGWIMGWGVALSSCFLIIFIYRYNFNSPLY